MRWALVLPIAFAVAVAVATAHAQPPADADAEALALYKEGLTRYNLAEYDAAIELFKRAYVRSEAPELLYNIAQAYRLKGAGSCGQALQFYRSYLRVAPTAPNRESVEAAITDVAKCARTEPAPEPAVVAPPHASRPAPELPPPADQPHRSRWPLVLAGAGAASTLVGGGLIAWAWSRYDAIDGDLCAPACDPADVDPPRMGQRVGTALIAIGLAASAAGVVLWLLDHPKTDRQAYLRPLGAGAELGFTF